MITGPITTPSGNKVYLRTEQNKVVANVCKDEGDCKETTLIEYSGFGWGKHAEESAKNLAGVIAKRDLYEGYIALKKDGRLVIDNSRLPFTAITLLDLSQENLTKSDRDEKIGLFLVNLWTSGILSAAEIAQIQIDRLETKILGFSRVQYRPRDAKLDGYLQLASAYFLEPENYEKAEKYANRIINYKLSVTTARPGSSDEAVFLLTDVKRITAIKTWSVEYMDQAMAVLLDNEKKLRKLELGYKVRYNYELLKTCVMYEQLFPGTDWRHYSHCQEEKLNHYYNNTTRIYNRRAPIFSDNFIAVRTFLQTATHHLSNGNLEEAKHEYQKAIYLVNFIKTSQSVRAGDLNLNWEIFSGYMGPISRTIGKIFGKRAGLWAFAQVSEIDRTFRGDFKTGWRKIQNDQFNPRFFVMFEAQAYRGLAGIHKKLADMDSSQTEKHLTTAKNLIEISYTRVKQIKQEDVIEFYHKKRFEERMAYYDVMVDYANVIIDLQSLGSNLSPEQLQLAEKAIEEVIRDKADEPTDVTYLKALLVQGNLKLATSKHREAAERYKLVLSGISKVETKLKGISLPPFYQYLKAIALGRLAVISEISEKK